MTYKKLIKYLKERYNAKKLGKSCARKLRQTAFAFVEIDQLRTQLELKKKRPV